MAIGKKSHQPVQFLVIKGIAVLGLACIFAACGDDSGNSSKANDDDGREVATLAEMGRCTSEREGDTVYVAEKLTDYLCKNKTWLDLSGILDSETAQSSSSAAKDDSLSAKYEDVSSSSLSNDVDLSQDSVGEYISITGVAQKGPFLSGSPLNLYELKKDLIPSGSVYKGEIFSNKGNFVIPKVNLAYPYAKLEVRGLYRNEVTGEWSSDSLSLRALIDFSDKRTEVNINLLTHLEYDRALYLVQEKGYSVYAAKKQAAQEIMTAFGFATTMTYSEDFDIFKNEGESAGTIAGNATILAISVLFMANRSDAEIQNVIDKFIKDIKIDGEWNDLRTKSAMADWAYEFEYSNIHESVMGWNILDIPDFETYLEIYWNNVYGLGRCSVNLRGIVAPNSNKMSKNYNKYFICDSVNWIAATTYQKGTYEWIGGETGEFKKGNVTDTIYVFDGSKWEVAEMETAIGICGTNNAGEVGKFENDYYICRDNDWMEATLLEYDTYGLVGIEGDVKAGVVNVDKYYVYENGAWRATSSNLEISLGVCTIDREGAVAKDGNFYYICKSKTWTLATTLEYDTYGWTAGAEGEVRSGSVVASNYYIFKNDNWQAASSVEKNLGGCTVAREGEVGKSGSTYYICKSNAWTMATALEYDTYGKNCMMDGSIVDGEVDKMNKYVCDAGEFRTASDIEISLDKGCVSYTKGVEIRKNLSSVSDSVYQCKNSGWKTSIEYGEYELLVDSRDDKTYKIVTIGTQTWMAENLNFEYKVKSESEDSVFYGFYTNTDNGDTFGLYYTWAAAMDSAGIYSLNSVGCGFGKTCTINTPARGICPEGWHIPTSTEWETLYSVMDSSHNAMKALGFTTHWSDATDAYGFSVLPAGWYNAYDGEKHFDCIGGCASFLSSTEYNSNFAYGWSMDKNGAALGQSGYKKHGDSVRCVKD